MTENVINRSMHWDKKYPPQPVNYGFLWAYGLLAGRDHYNATPAVTQSRFKAPLPLVILYNNQGVLMSYSYLNIHKGT